MTKYRRHWTEFFLMLCVAATVPPAATAWAQPKMEIRSAAVRARRADSRASTRAAVKTSRRRYPSAACRNPRGRWP